VKKTANFLRFDFFFNLLQIFVEIVKMREFYSSQGANYQKVSQVEELIRVIDSIRPNEVISIEEVVIELFSIRRVKCIFKFNEFALLDMKGLMARAFRFVEKLLAVLFD
jgi:hypothetical protein